MAGSKPKHIARLSVTLVAAAAQSKKGTATKLAAIAMDLRRCDVNGAPAARVWREEEGELDCGSRVNYRARRSALKKKGPN